MERAINLARGEKTIDYYQSQGPIYIKTPVVTKENVDEWIKKVSEINSKIENSCSSGKSLLGMGGMHSKIQAAKYATSGGVETLIGNGKEKGIIMKALGKNFPGTRFIAKKK